MCCKNYCGCMYVQYIRKIPNDVIGVCSRETIFLIKRILSWNHDDDEDDDDLQQYVAAYVYKQNRSIVDDLPLRH